MDDRPTFEQTYPKYPFSELVRIGLAVGAWILRLRRRAERPDAQVAPAEKTFGGPSAIGTP